MKAELGGEYVFRPYFSSNLDKMMKNMLELKRFMKHSKSVTIPTIILLKLTESCCLELSFTKAIRKFEKLS